jgi:cytidylate kinase
MVGGVMGDLVYRSSLDGCWWASNDPMGVWLTSPEGVRYCRAREREGIPPKPENGA